MNDELKPIMDAYESMKNSEKVNEKTFYRLPGNVVGNELYSFGKAVESFVSTQMNGNDFNRADFDKIIKMANNIMKQAKSFDDPDAVPVSYQFKKIRSYQYTK